MSGARTSAAAAPSALHVPGTARARGARIARRTLHADVTERLRDLIVEAELAPGERVDEKALCARFGVSRTPLREALKVLASEGLVVLLPNRGARITAITATGVAALFEAAAGLERTAAELAAVRASERELAGLARLQAMMERHHAARRRAEYFRVNQRIHDTVIGLARNEVLAELHAGLLIRIRRARYLANASRQRWNESLAEHRALLAALEARDAERAGRLLQAHMRDTGAAVCAVLEATHVHQGPAFRGRT